jgi:hypothetical protein
VIRYHVMQRCRFGAEPNGRDCTSALLQQLRKARLNVLESTQGVGELQGKQQRKRDRDDLLHALLADE